VAVEREKPVLLVNPMLQNDRRAIIKRTAVVVETVDNAIERGKDRGAGFAKEVNSKVKSPLLVSIVPYDLERLGIIEAAYLVITAQGDLAAGMSKTPRYPATELFDALPSTHRD